MTEWLLLAGAIVALTSAIVLTWTWRRRVALERRVLADERKQIAMVVAAASERARQIIAEAEGVRSELRANVAQAADKIVERVLTAYEEGLRAGLADFQKRLAEAGAAEMKRVQASVRKLETTAKADAKERIAALIPQVVRALAGKSVPAEVHEQAVSEALEAAAEGGLFTDSHEKRK